jgi:hypothetical protein
MSPQVMEAGDIFRIIMRAFARLRQILVNNKELNEKFKELEGRVDKHDREIQAIFEAIHQLMSPPEPPKKKYGFITGSD